jgi:Mrp family chromosome partitioning ATPase
VLLVEGDMINPTLATTLGLSDDDRSRAAQRGLGTALAGDHDVAAAVIPSPGGAPFALLPAGPSPTSRRQLWGDENAARLIDELRDAYDYVVIDTPPLTTVSDGAAVAAIGDGAIVLARIGHTKTKPLRTALQVLEAANAALLGTVVTCEPGHKRELSKPSSDAPRNLVSPKPDRQQAAADAPSPRGNGDAATETISQPGAINQAGVHRVSGAKREGR